MTRSLIPESISEPLYDELWNKTGADHQIDRLIEEAAELTIELASLTQALLKARRYGAIEHIYTKSVIDELGDVMLCTDQLRYKICKDVVFRDMLQKRIADKLVYMKEVAKGEKK